MAAIIKLLQCGLNHRETRDTSITDAYDYFRVAFIREYLRKSARFEAAGEPDPFKLFVPAVLKLALTNTRNAANDPNFNAEEDNYTTVEDYIDNTNADGKLKHPPYTATLKDPSVAALIEAVFTKFIIICTRVDKAANNGSYECPLASARSLYNETMPTADEIQPYHNFNTAEQVTNQLTIDNERLHNLNTINKQSITKPQQEERDRLQVTIAYITKGSYNGYERLADTPQEIRDKVLHETHSRIPCLDTLFPQEQSTGNNSGSESDDGDDDDSCNEGGTNNNTNTNNIINNNLKATDLLPGYLYQTSKYHKKPTGARGVASQSGSCSRQLDELVSMLIVLFYKLERRRCLKIFEDTGVNAWWIATNSAHVVATLPERAPNLEGADFVGCYDAIKHTQLKHELLRLQSKATAFWKRDKGMQSNTTVCIYIKREATTNPFQRKRTFAFLAKSPRQHLTIKRMGNDKDDTTICMSFNYFYELLELYIDTNFTHIGDSCYRRECGIGQGFKSSPHICDIYLHMLEDQFLTPLYTNIYDALTEQQRCEELIITTQQQSNRRRNPNDRFRLITLQKALHKATTTLKTARYEGTRYNNTKRYQDDLLALMDCVIRSFLSVAFKIYGDAIELKSTGLYCKPCTHPQAAHTVQFLDITITRKSDTGQIYYKQYDKRNDFPFKVATFDKADSNTPLNQQIAIFGSQSIRLYNTTMHYKQFKPDLLTLYTKFLQLNYDAGSLHRCLIKTFKRFGQNKYGNHGHNTTRVWIQHLRKAIDGGRSRTRSRASTATRAPSRSRGSHNLYIHNHTPSQQTRLGARKRQHDETIQQTQQRRHDEHIDIERRRIELKNRELDTIQHGQRRRQRRIRQQERKQQRSSNSNGKRQVQDGVGNVDMTIDAVADWLSRYRETLIANAAAQNTDIK
jgi:hypothetical protein